MKNWKALTVVALLPLAACGGGNNNISTRASESSAVAISSDDSLLVTVNENGNSITVFDATTVPPTKKTEVAVGKGPVAVTISPDNKTAFVVNQIDASVSKIVSLDGSPRVAKTVDVGAEPVAIALSPSGQSVYVAELAQQRVVKLNASNLNQVSAVNTPSPFGIAVTNNLNIDDNDETVIVTQFYGTPVTAVGAATGEGRDDSRQGVVHLFDSQDLSSLGVTTFNPLSTGLTAAGGGIKPLAALAGAAAGNPLIGGNIAASPNQLYAVAVSGNRFFVPTISASPARNVAVRGGNLHPIVLAADLSTNTQDAALTVNLEKKIQDLVATEGNRNFLSDTTSLAVSGVESTEEKLVMYAVSRGGDAVQRVAYNLNNNVISIDENANNAPDLIDLFPKCRTPMGMVVANTSKRAFVNCRGTRKLMSINLQTQALENADGVETSTPPVAGTDAFDIEKGQLLFFTARARWSSESRSDCAACHANGSLSDNIVWIFPAGPRRTVPMHWTYHDTNGDGLKDKQKALNWSAIFDEVRDFEGNITNVSGGKGVFTLSNTANAANCNGVGLGAQLNSLLDADNDGLVNGAVDGAILDNTGGNAGNDSINNNISLDVGFDILNNDIGLVGAAIDLEAQFDEKLCAPDDWAEVDAYTAALRSPRAPKTFGDNEKEASISRGRVLFRNAQCFACHGGTGWTSSEVPYEVTRDNVTNQAVTDFSDIALQTEFGALGNLANTKQIQTEQAAIAGGAAVGPEQITCVLRNVGTFGDPNNAAVTAALEVKNGNAAIAQGKTNGFNVPPLLGVTLSAPYLHHGQARTLKELFTDASWATHLKAAKSNFTVSDAQADDLANFVASIDTSTEPFTGIVDAVASPVVACPQP